MNKTFLTEQYPHKALAERLLPHAAWQPYPPELWVGLSAETRRHLVALGEQTLDMPWPRLPASLYLRYARDGDRAAFESEYFRRRDIVVYLTLAECVEWQGRFLDPLADALWSICEELSWCLPAHVGDQRAGVDLPDVSEPIVDLFAAETGMILAWSHHLLADRLSWVSDLVPARIEREIQSRILTPALERDDFWWMGFSPREVNNWNPWINANWLVAVLLIEKDQDRRVQSVHKIMCSLDRFIVPYPDDGGCDEGPSYWTRAGACLYDCLELLHSASSGAIDVYQDPKIQNIGRFVYRAHIADDYYVNFADAPALVSPNAALVRGYGYRIGDPVMLSLGDWLMGRTGDTEPIARKDPGRYLTRTLAALFPIADPLALGAQPPLLGDVYLPDIQFFAARDRAGSPDGLYLAAKGGHNDESHNHNDIGHFIVYCDGKPLLVDAGVETYTRKTFSPQRYEIWTMQSAYHALPTIDGVMQSPGREFAARDVESAFTPETARFGLDIAAAYPPEAKLLHWQRTLTLVRGAQVDLLDAYTFEQAPQELTLSLITPCQVDCATPGQIRLLAVDLPDGRSSAAGCIRYDPAVMAVRQAEIPLNDARLSPIWGKRLVRILFTLTAPKAAGSCALRIAKR